MADAIRIDISANTSGATEGIRVVVDNTKSLENALMGAGAAGEAAGDQIAQGMEKAKFSTLEAREASRLFAEETGLHIPRALSQIAARSEVLGPLLAKAFSAVALIAFADLAVKVAEKVTDWYISTFILTEAVKALNDEMAKDNKIILDATTQSAALKLRFEEIGLTAKQLTELKMDRLVAEIKKTDDSLRSAKDSLYLFRTGMTTMSNEEAARALGLPDSATVDQIIGAMSGKVGALNAQLEEKQQELTNQWKENELQKAAASKATHDKLVAQVMMAAKAGVDWTNQVKLDATQQAEAIGLIAQAHRNLADSIEPNNALLEQQGMKELENELKIAEATEKANEAELQLAAAKAKAASEQQADVVALDKASGHVAQQKKDVEELVRLLNQQKDAELAIVSAKIAEAAAAMQVAQVSGAGGGQDEAAYENALAQYRSFQAQKIAISAQADKQIAMAQDNELKQENTALNNYLNRANAAFANSFMQIIEGHETMGQAAVKMFEKMMTAMIEYFARFLEQAIISHSIHQALDASEKSSAASVAAAKAGKAVADIPVVGPALAVVAAATVYGAMMAFDIGGVVPGRGGQMAMVHGGERVLTENQNRALESGGALGGNRTTNIAPNITVNGDFRPEQHIPMIIDAIQGHMAMAGANF